MSILVLSLFPSVNRVHAQSSISVALPTHAPTASSNVVQDSFLGVSLEFNVLDVLSEFTLAPFGGKPSNDATSRRTTAYIIHSPLLFSGHYSSVGPDPKSIPVPVQNYLKNIGTRISSPLRIRVGGNSLDGSVFNPSASKMITFDIQSPANGVKNIPVTYGPQVATTLKASVALYFDLSVGSRVKLVALDVT